MKHNSIVSSQLYLNKELTQVGCVLAVCFGLLMALPTRAASLQLVADDWGTNGVPTNVTMYAYVPDNLSPNPPILVLLHYWGGGASGVFAEAQAGGIVAAADQYGFIMVVPQNPDCWDYSSAQSLTHDGGGQTEAIAHMVRYTISKYHANSDRVYALGTSCGGMMTEALLGVYPDIFKAGAEFSGVPIGGAWTPVTHTAQQWGDLARACYPGYSGHRPRIQLWHGTADTTVNYTNQLEAIMQWGNVLGVSSNPTYSNTLTIGSITNQFTHQVWVDGCGNVALDAWTEIGGGHGTDVNLNAQYVIPFLGLDKIGPVDPEDPDVYCGHGQRGRPHLNAARTTFVADNGQRLRGPFTSTEWTSASTDVAMIKGMGFNALHLYAESFDPSYPTSGSTAPGYAAPDVDSIVAQTRTNGLYLIMTIGNGANNGSYNRAYVTNFWSFYAARYANETHVLFEIQNEPVAWGPPYSSPTATPPGALDMEVAAYRTIRQYAPNTPVLLFTYSVLGNASGASNALTDIHAFNTNVFGTADVVWTNEAVGFHGYAGATAMSNAVSQIIAAGYPCFMTEFGGSVWGTGVGGLDPSAVAYLERLGVSWLTFQHIPPTGVSSDVTDPQHYESIVNWSGLSWMPDYGNWPSVRGPYGNGDYPWTTPGYVNNLLTGSLRVEAENFDNGGEGVAYHELTVTNLNGQYRSNEAVDIETTADTGGGYDITGTAAGEWLEYTLFVSQAGYYNLALRVAGTSAGSVQVLTGGINGSNLVSAWTVPATGGGQTWTTISNVVFLKPGQQVLHLGILTGGFNLNWIQFSPVASGVLGDGSYKLLNRASGLAATGNSTSNKVFVTSYTGSTSQRWNVQHIGGGQYKITSVENGWTLTSGGYFSWNSDRFLIQPTGNGYCQLLDTDNGYGFESVATNQTVIDEKVYAGGANQQWGVLGTNAPGIPTGLAATLSISPVRINLSWNPVAGAASYNVKRAFQSDGPYFTLASGLGGTSYSDTSVAAGVSYYYAVTAVVGGVESLNSANMACMLGSGYLGGGGVVSMEAENGAVGSRWITGTNAGASGGRYIEVNPIYNNTGSAPEGTTAEYLAAYDFNILTNGNYRFWFRTYSSSVDDDSFFWRIDGGSWKLENGRSGIGSWFSTDTAQVDGLGSGAHVLEIAYRENGTRLDKFVIQLDSLTAPSGNGPAESESLVPSAPPDAPTGLIATTQFSPPGISLSWNAVPNATSYYASRSTTSGGPYTAIAVDITATNYLDTSAGTGTNYYYVINAIAPAGASPDSNEAQASLRGLVSIINTASTTLDPSPGGVAFNYTVQQAGDVLVVATYMDSGGNALTSLAFGGNAQGGVIHGSRNSLFYYKSSAAGLLQLSNPSEAGNATGIFVWELSGVDLSAGVVSTIGTSHDPGILQLTTTGDNSFIVDAFGFNPSSNVNPGYITTADGDSILTKTFDLDVNVAGGGGWMSGGTATAGAAGGQQLGWNISAPGGGIADFYELAFAFRPFVSAGSGGSAYLTNSYNSGVLSLSWPAGQGWRLQAQTNALSKGLGTNWVYVSDATVSATNITVSPTAGSVFYRLAN